MFLLIGTPRAGSQSNDTTTPEQDERPNIVFIMTDDMAKSDLRHMPKTKKLLGYQGTTFDNAFVTYSLCCPARATFLTGQYTHNHGILTNAIYDRGGEPRFRELGRDKSTIATWLDGAGYRTAHVGKYMNGYDDTYVPPGWDEWYTLVGRFHVNQRLNENGKIKSYDKPSVDDILKQKSAQFLSKNAGNEPFYLQVSTHAPHGPASYPPRHADKFAGAKPPRYPSFNEKDLSDKPSWLRSKERLTQTEQSKIRDSHRNRLRSLLVVDDTVAQVVKVLREKGELSNTYIVFTSDNGYHHGEHRIPFGKWTPYEEAIRIPLVVRGPEVPAGKHRSQMVINNDFAPTFAEFGNSPAPNVDGRSFAPLLRNSVPETWRSQFLVESWHTNLSSSPPTYKAVRTRNMIYTEYRTNPIQRELYGLKTDPYQLTSRHRTKNRELVRRMRSSLSRLSTCEGAECRAAEGG